MRRAHQLGADPARRAEAAALVGEEVREVARHLEHVARAVEHHERAGRGHVLEGDAAAELARRQARPRRPADLHRLVSRAPRRRAPAATVCRTGTRRCRGARRRPTPTWSLVPADFGVPMRAHQAPPSRAMCAAAPGLDVVDHRRLAQVAVGHRERRADARDAALALERLDQRRLLAAHVRAGAEVDLDVEVEARRRPGPRARAARRRAAAPAPA
jgi:hypothetical protein